MRILVCSKRDLTSVVILNDLLSRLGALPGCTIGLWFAERTRRVETTQPELIRMKFLERDLPFGIVFPLIDARGDQPEGGAELRTAAGLVAAHRLEARTVTSLRAPATVAALDAFAPDLIVSVRFSFVFGPLLIARPPLGIVNIHPGALPGYAGLYPHVHAMLAGEDRLGCTVHRVDEGIDTGPILAAGSVPIDPARSAFAHNIDSHLLGNRLVADLVAQMIAGKTPPALSQDQAALAYHTYPTRAQFDRFQDMGFILVNEVEYLQLLKRFMEPAEQALDEPVAMGFGRAGGAGV